MLPEVYLQCRIDMLEPEAMPCDGFGWSKKDPSQHACTTLRQVPRSFARSDISDKWCPTFGTQLQTVEHTILPGIHNELLASVSDLSDLELSVRGS